MKQSPANTVPISILLVEDESDTREILSRMLTIKLPGIRLFCTENGKCSLELYQEYRPDLIITDVNMPLMDGLSMAGAIREQHQETHIIVLTAYNDTHYLLHAIETGITHYVLKPINLGGRVRRPRYRPGHRGTDHQAPPRPGMGRGSTRQRGNHLFHPGMSNQSAHALSG